MEPTLCIWLQMRSGKMQLPRNLRRSTILLPPSLWVQKAECSVHLVSSRRLLKCITISFVSVVLSFRLLWEQLLNLSPLHCLDVIISYSPVHELIVCNCTNMHSMTLSTTYHCTCNTICWHLISSRPLTACGSSCFMAALFTVAIEKPYFIIEEML